MSPEYSVRAMFLALTDPIFKWRTNMPYVRHVDPRRGGQNWGRSPPIVVSYCWQSRLCFECGLLRGQGDFGTVPRLSGGTARDTFHLSLNLIRTSVPFSRKISIVPLN